MVTYQLRPPQTLLECLWSSVAIHTHATQRLETIICEHEDASMIRFEVIDLFLPQQRPEVFAEEFYAVQVALGAGFVD